jgi:hypothetical protein
MTAIASQPTAEAAEQLRSSAPPDAKTIAKWLRIFIGPGQVTELRALRVKVSQYRRGSIWSGYFDHDHLDDMAAAALDLGRTAAGVYFIPNALDRDLLARRYNRVAEVEERDATPDKLVKRYKWLLVDCDPERISGISSTDEEKAEAKKVATRIYQETRAWGWDEPVVADSSNGYHLLFRIDEPMTAVDLIKRMLAKFAREFGTDRVKIDQTVFNPARICKLYGTVSRKGDNVPWRPWRISRVLGVPPALEVPS